jgi:hypothetical protein
VCVLVEAFVMERVPIASPQCCFHPGLGALGTGVSLPHGNGLTESGTYISMTFCRLDAIQEIPSEGNFPSLVKL